MASGIEVAGFILGVLPLIVSAIEDYREALEPVRIWARYHKDLQELRKVLEREKSKLLNTCEELLVSVVPEAELASLLKEPGGPAWSSATLNSDLRRLLRHSYSPFLSSLDDFKQALLELQKKLDLGLPNADTSSLRHHLWHGGVDRLKYAFGADNRSKLKDILKTSNKELLTLIRSALILAPSRTHKTKQAVDFEEVRKTACGIYDILETGPWHCSCAVPHNANLLLEPRIQGSSRPEANQQVTLPLRFRVLFSFDMETVKPLQPPWNWHETDIVPLECYNQAMPPAASQIPPSASAASSSASAISTSMPPPAKKKKTVRWSQLQVLSQPSSPSQGLNPPVLSATQISNLCATLQQVCEGKGCLGALTDHHKRLYQIIAVRRQPRALASKDLVSLADILLPVPTTVSVSNKPSSRQPSAADRRMLALTFASTMLQLHETPWLNDRWNKEDIVFLRDVSVDRKPIFRQPYISKGFSSAVNTICASTKTSKGRSGPMIRNQSLFDLGVLLIELCFKKPLEAMRQPEDLDDDGKVNMYTDFATANRLIEAVYGKFGARYGDAVRRCVRCEFDQRNESFENDKFRQAVYNKVLLPLESELRDFTIHDGGLPAIL